MSMTGEEIAKELGVRFAGRWEDLDTFLFNDDNHTDGSFSANSLEEAREKLKKMREAFAMASKDSCPIKKFTDQDLKRVAEGLEIYPGDFPNLLEGMEVELEHCDFTEGDAMITARIALAHLRENPDYYRKLKEAGL